jgi:hypothetical protein
MEFRSPENESPVTEMFAFLSIDPRGNEGVVATGIDGIGVYPLVFSKKRLVEKMEPMVIELAKEKKVVIRLCKFTAKEVLKVYGTD